MSTPPSENGAPVASGGDLVTPPAAPTPPNPEPVVVTRPAPTPAAAPPAPVTSPPPADWRGSERAWEQLVLARQDRATAEQAAAAAKQRALEAEQHRAQLAQELESERMNRAMMGLGGDFGHADVQRFFREQYRAATSGLEQAPAFADWVQSEPVKTSPLYSRFFQPVAPVAPVTPATTPAQPTVAAPVVAAPPPAPPNVDQGAGGGGPPQSAEITPQMLRAWSQDPGWSESEHRAAAIAQAERKYGRKIVGTTRRRGEK